MSDLYPNAAVGESSIKAIKAFINEIKTDLKSEILQSAYPIGSLYFNYTNKSNPSTLLGFGTWEKIETFVLGASASHPAGEEDGEETHTLTISEMPSHTHSETSTGSHTHGGSTGSAGSHTHTRGTMNIEGKTISGKADVGVSTSGAFSLSSVSASEWYRGISDSGSGNIKQLTFNASDEWSGETSSPGNHTHSFSGMNSAGSHSHSINNTGGGNAHNNMPPYTSVYIWKRTA